MKYGALFVAFCIAIASPAMGSEVSDARGVFGRFSQCTVERHSKESVDVVLSDVTADEIFRKYPGLLSGDCFDIGGGDLKIPGADFVRYGLAEALMRRDYAHALPPDISLAAPLPHRDLNEADYRPKAGKTPKPKELAELQKQRERDGLERLLSIFGECIVRADPAAALQLVVTKPSSAEENQAFDAMNGALASCLVSGQKLEFSKGALRGTIAMNLYRLARAPRVQAKAAQAK
jgi:hypothetical protein